MNVLEDRNAPVQLTSHEFVHESHVIGEQKLVAIDDEKGIIGIDSAAGEESRAGRSGSLRRAQDDLRLWIEQADDLIGMKFRSLISRKHDVKMCPERSQRIEVFKDFLNQWRAVDFDQVFRKCIPSLLVGFASAGGKDEDVHG